ncbi:MAG: PD40 domain-containing protein [Candidatus Omnitrophica bacterium]|nr:PD40 domain-containing protein [Candidatus Omnitrophota bacterium]
MRLRKYKRNLLAATALIGWMCAETLLPAIAQAQETIQVTPGGFQNRKKVAIAELDLARGGDPQLQAEYQKTMAYDLDFSDLFEPMPNNAQMASQHAKDRQMRAIDYRAWQNLTADILVKAEFEDYGDKGLIRFWGDEVYGEESLVALEFQLAYDSRDRKIREVRRAVHNFTDALVQKYDPEGFPGCAQTYIAFVNAQWKTDRNGKQKKVREIFIMDYDGRNIRQITQDRDLAISPAWAPDGRMLAYTTYRTGNADVYVYNLNTGKISVLAAFPGMNAAPSWSPDGNQLALTLSRDGNPEIYRIRNNGSSPVRITTSRSVETSPTWTPDGSQILFISDRLGAPKIYRVSANGGNPSALTTRGHNDDPDVSPRGDRVVYTSNQGGGGFDVWVSDLNGGNAVNLTSGLSGCEHPSWAPDGRHIVFAHRGQIMVMDADGTDKRRLTDASRIPGENESPAWGPSGLTRKR